VRQTECGEEKLVFDMRRRDFILLLGGTAAAWPLAAHAQQRLRRIGVLETTSTALNAPDFNAFHQSLHDLGYVEGQNLTIEYRSAEGRMIRMLIIGYVFAIRSERAICRDLQVNLAYRWFCGLSIENKIPDHSVFSRARHERFRESDMFRRVFERVVEACIAAGLD
jgi:hypothetical protein